MSEFNKNVPLLGQQQGKVRTAPQVIVSLVRAMDENGTFEPESTQLLPNGGIQATAGRSNLMSGEDLVAEVVDALIPRIKELIRQEFAYQKTLDRNAYEAEVKRVNKVVESLCSSEPY